MATQPLSQQPQFSLEEVAAAFQADPNGQYMPTLRELRNHYTPTQTPAEAIDLMCEAIEAGKSHLLAELVAARQATGVPATRATVGSVIDLFVAYTSLKAGVMKDGTLTPEHIRLLGPMMVNISGGAIRQSEYAVPALRQVCNFLIGLTSQPAAYPP